MSGDYQSLADAVREPMRRWWMRVIPWWMGALLLYLVWLIVDYSWLMPAVEAETLPFERLKQFNLLGNVLNLAFYPGTRLLWILAALNVNAIVTKYLFATKQADDTNTTSLRFVLGMQQVWVLLIVSTLFNIATDLAGWYYYPAVGNIRPSLWYALASSFYGPLAMISAMIWFIAFISIVHQRPKLLWWWFGLYTLLPAAWGLVLSTWIALGLPFEGTAPAYPADFSAYPWAVGLLILLALIDGFHNRKSWLAYGAYILAILGSLLSLLSGIALKTLQSLSWAPSSWQTGLMAFYYWQQALGYLPSGASPTAYSPDGVPRGAQVWLLQADWVIVQGHEALILLALALDTLWLALLYAFLRFFVLKTNETPKTKAGH